MVGGHGTGTPVGDTIEFNSVSTVYGHDGRCALTSVKSNFGHAESAAGVLGLMKAVLSVHNGVVPRNLHFNRLPDHLARIETGLFVPQETTAWPVDESGPRRAGVSSYGMSGTNVHVVLEQAPEPPCPTLSPTPWKRPRPAGNWSSRFPRRRPGTAAHREPSGRVGRESGRRAGSGRSGLPLSRRRGHRPARSAVIAADRSALVEGLRAIADGDEPYPAAVGQDDRGPVWVFSGQGSQWASMGAELLAGEPFSRRRSQNSSP